MFQNSQKIKHNLGQVHSTSSGQAIFPLVLILTAVFGLIGVTFAGVAYLQSLLSSQRAFAEQTLQAAASGVDDALLRLARDGDYVTSPDYTITVDDVDATVTVSDTPAAGSCSADLECRTIETTATKRSVTRSLEVIVEISASGTTRVLSRQEVTN